MTDDERDLHTHHDDLFELQFLDPARDSRRGAGHEPAAQALLDRIIEEPRSGTRPDVARRPRWHRWALAATAAAAVAVSAVVLPLGGTPQEPAFATWTPAPEEITASSLDDVGAGCTPGSGTSDVWEQHAKVAETRGRITFLLAVTPTRFRTCLLVDGDFHSSGSGTVPKVTTGLSPSAVQSYAAVGSGGGTEAYTALTGRVGEDVIGVEIHPRAPVTEPSVQPTGELPESVTATVDNGHYAAWWPDTADQFSLTIHLVDGTVLSDVPAFGHDR